jgi:hypothetical protein
MDKFLDIYDHPKLNKEDINHLNRSITQNEIEATISLPKRKVQDLTDLPLNSTRPLKKLIPILHKLFHKVEKEGILPKSFCEAHITLISKLDKDTTQKRITGKRCKNPP